MPFSELQNHYWRDRYALRDSSDNIIEHDIRDTWWRVARAMGDTSEEVRLFYDLLLDFKFVPGGRILAGAGAEALKTFYNCYVIPVETKARRENRKPAQTLSVNAPDWEQEFRFPTLLDDHGNDSREAIFDTISTMVSIMSRGGGVGINWSVLRPRNAYLTRVSGHSSGPVGWMDVASTAVGEVIQGGSRRGAAMFMLDVWHPDVLDFINAKRDNSKITNANISVGITEAFMEAVRNDEDWTFIFPDTTHPAYDTNWTGNIKWWQANGYPVISHGTASARGIWRQIAEAAHASGEPGVIFLDRYNELSTANGEETIICVNPCGEQGLGAYSVCNLGAMNLYAYVRPDANVGHYFAWDDFYKDVGTAIRFLDNVIDKTPDYLDETVKRQQDLRRIGLGVMGLADALVALRWRYGGPEAIQFTEDVFVCMKDAAIEQSSYLGYEKGAAKGWKDEMWERPYLKDYLDRNGTSELYYRDLVAGEKTPLSGLRNIFLLTQAPTGTTSLLAGVNSGIEPYFALSTWREDRTGGRWVSAKAIEDIGGVEHGVPDYVVTASSVIVEEHIAMQAAAQRYIDSSVSKTINAPNEQTVDEVIKAFDLAYESGLKGIAYYRDGSRNKQVLYREDPNARIGALEEEVANLKAKLAFRDRTVEATVSPIAIPLQKGDDCPSCDVGSIVYEEGCQKCFSCGWSAC